MLFLKWISILHDRQGRSTVVAPLFWSLSNLFWCENDIFFSFKSFTCHIVSLCRPGVVRRGETAAAEGEDETQDVRVWAHSYEAVARAAIRQSAWGDGGSQSSRDRRRREEDDRRCNCKVNLGPISLLLVWPSKVVLFCKTSYYKK